MALKVFLSHSTNPEEQSIVWRLQTLGAAHGIEVYVPRHAEFRFPSSRAPLLPEEVRKKIDQSDCVLAIITTRTGPAVEKELSYALGREKPIIPIVESSLVGQRFLEKLPRKFVFSPGENPTKIEAEIVNFLKQESLSKDRKQAIGALVAIGLGLLLLYSLAEK